MKKYICIFMAVLSAFALSSCKKQEVSSSQPITMSAYVNGTYTAEWGDYIDGWKEFVTVSIENDKVTVLQYDAKSTSGILLSTSTDFDEEIEKNAQSFGLPAVLTAQRFKSISSAYDKDSDLETMECVAGATLSTNRFKIMLEQLLEENAANGITQILEVPVWEDGIYRVDEARFNGGWKDFVEVTVMNGIPKVTMYDSYNKEGILKSEDEDTKTRMISYCKAKGREELYPALYIEQLVGRFDQSKAKPEEIENVAGATISSNIFKQLTGKALENAATRGKHNDTIGKYKDGSYYAEMSVFTDGWKDFVTVEIKDDIIRITKIDALDEEGKLKSEDAKVKEDMMKGNTVKEELPTYPEKYYKDIVSSFSQSGGEVLDMENVSGATLSCNNFKLMVGEILRTSALEGEPYQIKVEPLT